MFNRLRQLGLAAGTFEKASMQKIESKMRQDILDRYAILIPHSARQGKKLTGAQEIEAINGAGDKYHELIGQLKRKDASERAMQAWEHDNASKDFHDAKHAIFSDHTIQPDDYRRKLTSKYDDVFDKIEAKKAAYRKRLAF